jgi:hypothetical protein
MMMVALLLCVSLVASCGGGSSNTTSASSSAGEQSLSLSLTPGTYYWSVTATDSNGGGATSAVRQLVVQ